MKPVIVVGSINMDLVCVAERAPRSGETVFGSDFQMYSGGKGANQAVAAARLGSPAILLGKVGTDIFGTQLLDILANDGVDISHIERVSCSTGTATIVVDGFGENSIIVTPGANMDVTPEYIDSKIDILRGAGMVLAQLEIPIETISRLAELCEELQVPLMLDPAPAQPLDAATMARVSWLTPNQTEAEFYVSGAVASEETIQDLLGRNVQNVILKRGNAGVLIGTSRNGGPYAIDPFRVSVVDTTAAGDSFNGAFAVAQVRGFSVEASARYAAAAAALSVTRKGAQSSLPTSREVDLFLASFETNAHA